jgi:hypothetical protein
MAILNDKKCKNKGRLNVLKAISKTIRRKIVVFEEEGTRGNFVAKLRLPLEDDTLNGLCFLRAYFTKEKKAQNEKKSVILI